MNYDAWTHGITVRPCHNGFVVTHHNGDFRQCHGVEYIAADVAEVCGVVVKILTTTNLRGDEKGRSA